MNKLFTVFEFVFLIGMVIFLIKGDRDAARWCSIMEMLYCLWLKVDEK